MKRKCIEKMKSLRTTQVENLLESIRQIAGTNTIFTAAGICSTTDFFAIKKLRHCLKPWNTTAVLSFKAMIL